MDARLTQLTLISQVGTSVGLLQIMTELNVFEDLFSNIMTGNIVINDSMNLINVLPITGNEVLIVGFENPEINLAFHKTFRIYKISDRNRVTETNETYILHFCSEELLLSDSLLISRTYTQQTISAIVASISTSILRIPTEKLVLRGTSIPHTIHIPAFHPFKAINYVCRYAGNFLFYESADAFHFEDLEHLSQQTAIQQLTLSPRNIGFERNPNKTDLQQSLETAETISFPEAGDTLRNTGDAMYGGTLITVDPLRRRIRTYSYNGQEQFNRTKHLNKYSLISIATNRFGKSQTQYPESVKKVVVTTKDHDHIQYAQGKQLLSSNRIEQWLLPRQMYLTGIHAHRVTAAIPGNLRISIGSVIDLKLPATEEQETGTKKLDLLYSGNYLVTAIRHKIDRRKYSCIIELSKDSGTRQYGERK